MASTNSGSSRSSSRSSPQSRRSSLQAPLQSTELPVAGVHETQEEQDPSSPQNEPSTGDSALQVEWTFTQDAEEDDNEDRDLPSSLLDIVVIPGIYGSGKELSDESSNSWALKYLKSFAPGSRLMMFDWDASNLFVGFQTRDSTEVQARRLLGALSNISGERSLRRSIMFIADDLGSMVLKQALTIATASKATNLLDIVDRTRALDKLAEFVLGGRTAEVSFTVKPTMAAFPGLAEAVMQVNGLFILSNIPVKCSLVSIHHGGRFDSGQVSSVFDEFVGTFGLPFEHRICVKTGGQGQLSPVLDHLEELNRSGLWPDAEAAEWMTTRYERTLMSLSSSITTFRTPFIEQWSLQKDVQNLIDWSDATTTDVLYLYGGSHMQEIGEQIFYVYDQQRRRGIRHGQVLYFSFSKDDTTRNTLKDMLATFLAQMICHHANEMHAFAVPMFTQFSEEYGWTDKDLLQWFSLCRNVLFAGSAYLVIDGFDECPESGRRLFMEWFDQTTAAVEGPWKLAITSQRLLKFHLAQKSFKWKQVDLAGTQPNDSLQSFHFMEMKSLIRKYRPELYLISEDLLQSIDLIANGDILIQEIVLAYALSVPKWPRRTSLEDLFSPLPRISSSEEILSFILNKILRMVPAKWNVGTMLLWLLYSARPFSLWELASIASLDCLDTQELSPQADIMREYVQMCETLLRGIIDIRDAQVSFRHPRIRKLLMKPIESTGTYIWDDINASKANHHITETCLHFLSKDDVQRDLESEAQETILGETWKYGLASEYTSFCSYAAYYWPRHASLVRNPSDISSLLETSKQSALTATWLKAFWCLSNPVTRSTQHLESLDALLVGLRLPHTPDDNWDVHGIAAATREAAARGHSDLVKTLLSRSQQPTWALIDILKAAASSGKEKLASYVFKHIRDTIPDKVLIQWPPCLLYRAAWLGMNHFAGQLLEAGCSADPGGPMSEKPRLSPLHQAARHGHRATIETLLSHGADTGFLTVFSRNVLFSASHSGSAEVFKILFEKGKLNLADTDEFNDTPLTYAADFGRKTTVKSLLKMGADPCDGKDPLASNIEWLPLVTAASRGRTECVRILLDHDTDPNQPGPKRESTALYHAAVNNFPHTLRVLLERGADPNHSLLKTPILVGLASAEGLSVAEKIKMIDMVMERKAKVDATDSEGMTALMHAVLAEEETVVTHLLELGASVDIEDDEYKRSPLHFASDCGSEAILRSILARGPDTGHLDHLGRSPLSYSVQRANMASILLEHGINPDLTHYEGYTPLIFAAMGGHSETVKALLDHHADVDLRCDSADGNGGTAMSWATEKNHADIVRMLADAGANLSYKYGGGMTALHFAPPAVAKVLLQYRKRLDIDALDRDEWTPLYTAVSFRRDTELVHLLVNNGANLNLKALDSDGTTPLAAAARSSNLGALKVLLREEDCDPKITSRRGRGPLQYAIMLHKTIEAVQLLVERGADVNQTSKSAVGTPLQLACKNKEKGKEMIQYLLEHGADLDAQGGTLGFAISAAAMYGTPEISDLLLQRGASVNVTDAMGRKPIHLACIGSGENFQQIYKAGGNQHLQDRDNMGRSTFHWVAQHGWPETLEQLIAEMGTDLLDSPDVDGWTPLMWTCLPRFNSEEDSDERRKRRLRVFQILLEQGARPDTTGKVGETSWSLRDHMAYNDIDQECISLLDKALVQDRPPVPSVTTEAKQARRIGALKSDGNWECDACYCSIRGLLRTCSECYVDLCNKCYWHRDLVHDHGCKSTQWKETGPEFVEDKEEAPVEPSGKENAGEGGTGSVEEDDDSDSVWSKNSDSSSE